MSAKRAPALTSTEIAELHRIRDKIAVAVTHWAFAPASWAALHKRGFIGVEYFAGRLVAEITDAGRDATNG